MPGLAGAFACVETRERLLILPYIPADRVPNPSRVADLALRRVGATFIEPSAPGVAIGLLADERVYASAAVVSASHGHAGVLLMSLTGGPELAARASRLAGNCRVLESLASPTRIRDATRTLSFPVPTGAMSAVRDGNGALIGPNWEIRLGEVKPYVAAGPLAQAEKLLSAAGAKLTTKTQTRTGGNQVALAQGTAGSVWVQVGVIDLEKKFGALILRAEPDGVIAGQQALLALLAGVETATREQP
jgi:hypothetical protein